MKKRTFAIAALPLLALTVGFFQNCAGGFQSNLVAVSTSGGLFPSSLPNGTGGGISLSAQIMNLNAAPGDTVNIPITLNEPATGDLSFTYATADETAIAGTDYTSASGSGTIKAGASAGVITVATINTPGLIYLGKSFAVQVQIPGLSFNQSASVTFTSGLGNVALTNQWSSTSTMGAPSGRVYHTSVWTGSKMLVWGGTSNPALTVQYGDGAIYDPALNTWTAMSANGAPSYRDTVPGIWTGSQMIIWGGYHGSDGTGDGAMFNPTTNSWTAMSATGAPSARYWHNAVWTGSKMIVWGGCFSSVCMNNGGIFDPVANSWTSISTTGAPEGRINNASVVWTGTEMIVWGGGSLTTIYGDGAIYNPTTNTWRSMSGTGAPALRVSAATAWTGSAMLVWGGQGTQAYADGASFDPVSNTWKTISASPLSNRQAPGFVWTGTQMIVWGGFIPPSSFGNDGATYNPATDSWTTMTSTSPPMGRANPAAVWTGSSMIIWGGENINVVNGSPLELGDGGIYR